MDLKSFFILFFVKTAASLCTSTMEGKIVTCENMTIPSPKFKAVMTHNAQVVFFKNNRITFHENYHQNAVFTGLTGYIITNNNPLKIHPYSLKGLENLKYLQIKFNVWPVIQSNTTYGLTSLEKLEIIQSGVTLLEKDCFNTMHNLQMLVLESNNFEKVPNSIFKSLGNLRELSLYDNGIETLGDNCFEGLDSLYELRLSKNKLKVLETSTFNKLQHLAVLYLNTNKIAEIQGNFDLPNLKFLYMYNNEVARISERVFGSLNALAVIDVSSNKINYIDVNAFRNIPTLININYKNNSLVQCVDFVFNFEKPFVIC